MKSSISTLKVLSLMYWQEDNLLSSPREKNHTNPAEKWKGITERKPVT